VPEGITLNRNVILQTWNGVGGVVNIEAASGDVKTQLISTNGQKERFSLSLNDAYGGAITLKAFDGSISTGKLLSFSHS